MPRENCELFLTTTQVAIKPLASRKRFIVVRDVLKARHRVCARLTLDFFGISQHDSNNHVDNSRVDQKYFLNLLCAKVVV